MRPIICHASWPIARTSPDRLLSAITEGSFKTMPSPRAYTSVLAVPRSIARSRARVRSPQLLCRRDARYRSAEGGVAIARPERGPEAAPGSPTRQDDGDETTATTARNRALRRGTARQGRRRRRSRLSSGAMSVMCWDSRPHDSPADQRSRFQIGTVDLRVSIPNRAASKAAGRWGADATTMTDDSPMSTGPIR